MAKTGPAAITKVLSRYQVNKRLIEGAAAAFGVTSVFVWQPSPFYNYDQSRDIFLRSDEDRHDWSTGGYVALAKDVRENPPGNNFIWCADIQEGRHEPLYVDRVHYAVALSKALAACIVTQLNERQLLARSAAALP
jgi:hypothetical protein